MTSLSCVQHRNAGDTRIMRGLISAQRHRVAAPLLCENEKIDGEGPFSDLRPKSKNTPPEGGDKLNE